METNHLDEIIRLNSIIEIKLFNSIILYDGVLLKADKNIVILINYDTRNKEFDGISIFRNENFDVYTVYHQDKLKIKNNNLNYFKDIIGDTYQYTKIIDFFKIFHSRYLFAIFLKVSISEYYIVRIKKINRKSITTDIISVEGRVTRTKRIEYEKIKYISFSSKYERKIENKLLGKNDKDAQSYPKFATSDKI